MSTIRVLLVDDHTLFRDGLHAILTNVPDIVVVGQAGTGREAVAQVESLSPDVILMDINMPELNGIEATQQVLARAPATGIVMLTMLEDSDSLFAAMCVGARLYLEGGGQGRGGQNDPCRGCRRSALRPGDCRTPERILPARRGGRTAGRRPAAIPRSDGARTRSVGYDRRRRQQPGDRAAPAYQQQDHEQPYLEHLWQVAGG